MNPVFERRLGPAGIDWIRESIVGTRLGNLVLERYSLDGGVATALLPHTVTDEAAHNFWEGVLENVDSAATTVVRHADGTISRLVPTPSTEQALALAIQSFLRQSSSRVCVFEDKIRHAGHPHARVDESGSRIFDDGLFYVVSASHSDLSTIANTIRKASPGVNVMLGVLGSLPLTTDPQHFDLVCLVTRLSMVIVDAYDGESYVMWRPS